MARYTGAQAPAKVSASPPPSRYATAARPPRMARSPLEVAGQAAMALAVHVDRAGADHGEAAAAGRAEHGQGVSLQLEEAGLQEQQLLQRQHGQFAVARAQDPQLPRGDGGQAGPGRACRAGGGGGAPHGHGEQRVHGEWVGTALLQESGGTASDSPAPEAHTAPAPAPAPPAPARKASRLRGAAADLQTRQRAVGGRPFANCFSSLARPAPLWSPAELRTASLQFSAPVHCVLGCVRYILHPAFRGSLRSRVTWPLISRTFRGSGSKAYEQPLYTGAQTPAALTVFPLGTPLVGCTSFGPLPTSQHLLAPDNSHHWKLLSTPPPPAALLKPGLYLY